MLLQSIFFVNTYNYNYNAHTRPAHVEHTTYVTYQRIYVYSSIFSSRDTYCSMLYVRNMCHQAYRPNFQFLLTQGTRDTLSPPIPVCLQSLRCKEDVGILTAQNGWLGHQIYEQRTTQARFVDPTMAWIVFISSFSLDQVIDIS